VASLQVAVRKPAPYLASRGPRRGSRRLQASTAPTDATIAANSQRAAGFATERRRLTRGPIHHPRPHHTNRNTATAMPSTAANVGQRTPAMPKPANHAPRPRGSTLAGTRAASVHRDVATRAATGRTLRAMRGQRSRCGAILRPSQKTTLSVAAWLAHSAAKRTTACCGVPRAARIPIATIRGSSGSQWPARRIAGGRTNASSKACACSVWTSSIIGQSLTAFAGGGAGLRCAFSSPRCATLRPGRR
jgi:hypothetical protein